MVGLLWVAGVLPRASADETASPEPTTTAPAPTAPSDQQVEPPLPLDAFPAGPLDDPLEPHRPRNPRTLSGQEKLEAYTYYSIARLLEGRQDMAGAMRMYQLALRHDPESLAVYRELIPLAFRLNRGDEAMRYALKLAELDPSDQLTLRRLAGYLSQPEQGDFERAVRLLELAVVAPNMVHDSPDYVNVMNDLGRLYAQTDQPQKAATAYQTVVEALDNPEKYRLDQASMQLLASDRNYEQIGKVFLKAGLSSDAIRAFEKAEEVAVNKGRFSFHLAQVYFETADYERSLAELEKYFDQGLGARNEEPYELLAEILKRLDRSSELVAFLQRAAEKDPQNSVLQLYLADQHRASGQFEEAESLYRSLLDRSKNADAYQGLAEVYRETKRPKELLGALAAILQTAGRVEEPLAREIQKLAGDSALVDALVETARNSSSQDLPAGSMHVMALVATEAKRVDSAAEFFELALEQRPDDLALYDEFARMHYANERYTEAAAVYQKAIDRGVEPNSPTLHISLARQLELAGRTDEAIAASQGALAISDNLLTRFYHAWVFYHARRFDQAQEEYEKLLATAHESPIAARDPDYVAELVRDVRFILSGIRFELGDLPGAEEMLEQVLEQDPDDPRANNDLGYLLADQGKDLDRAEMMVRKAVEKEPDNAAYLDSLGWVLYKRGSFQESVGHLEKAVEKLEEGDSVIWDHLGDAYLRTDQVEKARTAWQKAVDLYRKQPQSNEKKIEEIQAKLNVTAD
jgi:tetratricopeptide (TPR) repeat protein